MAISYREKPTQKKNVILISKKSRATTKNVQTRQPGYREPIVRTKPTVVLGYNHNMGGVDQSDIMLYGYLDDRRTVKYWKKVALSIMNRMIVNAYILYKDRIGTGRNIPKPMTRYAFYIKCVDLLAADHLAALETATTHTPRCVVHIDGTKEKNCCVCSDRKTPGGRKRARRVCGKCSKAMHCTCLTKHTCRK